MQHASQIRAVRTGFALRYRRCIEQPILIIGAILLLCLLAGLQLQNFRFDASTDSLIARGDPELKYFEEISARFANRPVLVITYRPLKTDLFSREGVRTMEKLVEKIESISGVSSVQSLLDAPLLRSPPVPLSDLAKGFRTLRSPDVDFNLARQELLTSPVFSELLINEDGILAAIVVTLDEADGKLSTDAQGIQRAGEAPIDSKDAVRASTSRTIEQIREIRSHYQGSAQIFLGGVPLVASDMVRYIRHDMLLFGLAVLALIAAALYGFFRELRWVFIPLGTSAVTVWLTMGVMAAVNLPVTAVSSNFVALLTITTVSFSVHLIAAHRENAGLNANEPACDIAFKTMSEKLAPCLYTAFTTMVAFGSLLVSDIVPIQMFGWMMCIGIAISLLVTYSFFASILVLLPSRAILTKPPGASRLTLWCADISTHRPGRVITGGLIICILTGIGLSKITLGNRIVEYFRADTEIRQGLNVIDRELGGTIPLDVIIQFPPFKVPTADSSKEDDVFSELGGEPFDDLFENPFEDPFLATNSAKNDPYPERFWFTPEKLRTVEALQTYMEQQPGIGKTLSVSNFERVAREFNNGEALSYITLTAALDALPQEVRRSFIDPHASPAAGQMRISARLHETGDHYELAALVSGIEDYARDTLGLAVNDVRVTGIGVLFNNMLKLFFQSQRSTFGVVLLATLGMFVLLLRSTRLALIGVLPNVLAALVVLAVMGFFSIPLDIMTITITSIAIGIGVDDAIHYLHRFRLQLKQHNSVQLAIQESHRTTGQALYFTSLTVVAGFSVLILSRFVPTAYFGALTALAMLLALGTNLVLLPALLVQFYKPTKSTI